MGNLCVRTVILNSLHVRIDNDDDKVNEECSAMISCNSELISALSIDPLSIAGILLSKGLISEEINAKMLISTFTNREKSTILVNTLREKIKLNPLHFYELIDLFFECQLAQDIADVLLDTYQGTASMFE